MPVNANSYGPYATGAGANIQEAFWRLMTRWFAPSAVVANYLNELAPFGDSTGLQVKVNTGGALVRGEYGEWTTTSTLGLAAVGGIAGGSERWDRLVVRNDFVNKFMTLDVLTGTASASPSTVRPTLTQSSSMWEFLLADVGPLINTTTTVTAAMVIDGRWKMTESGILYSEKVLGATAASIAIPGAGFIPNGRTLLLDWAIPVCSVAAASALGIQVNGDNGTNYNYEIEDAVGNVAPVDALTSAASFGRIGVVPGTASAAGAMAIGTTRIPWANITGRKQWLSQQYREDATSTGLEFTGAVWSGTAAITSLLLLLSGASFSSGSSVICRVEP